MSNTFDPLASAKMSASEVSDAAAPAPASAPAAPEGKSKRSRAAESSAFAASPEAKGVAASPEPPLPSPGASPEPPLPVTVYEVEETCVVFYESGQVRLPKGKRVSLATHSAELIDAARAAGAKLKPVVS